MSRAAVEKALVQPVRGMCVLVLKFINTVCPNKYWIWKVNFQIIEMYSFHVQTNKCLRT